MNWDFFQGFWAGVISLIFVEIMIVKFVPDEDDNNHIKPA